MHRSSRLRMRRRDGMPGNLWKHDFCSFCEVIRLIFFHPENLRCGKACKCNVCGILERFFFSDYGVQIIGLFLRYGRRSEDRRADDVIVLIQDDKAMHLAAEADAGYLGICLRLLPARGFPLCSAPTSLPVSAQTSLDAGNTADTPRYNIYNFAFLVHHRSSLTAEVPRSTPIKYIVESPFSSFQKGRQQT